MYHPYLIDKETSLDKDFLNSETCSLLLQMEETPKKKKKKQILMAVNGEFNINSNNNK